MNARPREDWIDAARGIGITLVVAFHNPGLWSQWPALGQVLASFIMPLFFAIAGTTLSWRPAGRTTALRVAGLLIPYAVLSLLSLPMAMKRPEYESLWNTLLGSIYGTGHTIVITPLWFLPCLAVSLLVVHALDAAVGRVVRRPTAAVEAACALGLLVAGLLVLRAQGDVLPVLRLGWGEIPRSGALLNLDLALVGAGFIVLGRLMGTLIRAAVQAPVTRARCLQIAIGLCALYALAFLVFDPQLDMNLRLVQPAVATLAVAMLGSAAALWVIHLLRHTAMAQRLAAPVGRSTLVILWLHAGLEKRVWQMTQAYEALPAALGVALSVAAGVLVPLLLDRLLMQLPKLRGFIYPQPWLARFKRRDPRLAIDAS